jgi:hypothetical protein
VVAIERSLTASSTISASSGVPEHYGIEAVEYVNQFFKDKAEDPKYLAEMKTPAQAILESLMT